MSATTDRIAGTLLGLAAGDALGAGYEFGSAPLGDDEPPEMIGGGLGGFAPGEWTDDTSMAICIAEVTASGSLDLDAIGDRFLDWYRSGPADVGISTAGVLRGARSGGELRARADHYFAAHPRGAAGNGSLMRTAPVALAMLDRPLTEMAEFAREVSHLTHGDPLAADACVLWCAGIQRAITGAGYDGVRDGLELVPVDRRDRWAGWLEEAELQPPSTFTPNGFVVPALQAAYAAVVQTPVPEDGPACVHLQCALEAAVHVGNDTDTVAAIAGGLLGARWGASAVPFRWRRMLHGWPGYGARDLVRLAVLTARGGEDDEHGWPLAPRLSEDAPSGDGWVAALPADDGVLLGNLAGLDDLDGLEADAVLSLCRGGTEHVPEGAKGLELYLIDQAAPEENSNLDFVLADTADAIAVLCAEGKRVFLHSAGGASRTPAIAAAYLVRHHGFGIDQALEQVAEVGPYNPHDTPFRRALEALSRPARQLVGLGRPRPDESREAFAARFAAEIERALARPTGQEIGPMSRQSGDDSAWSPDEREG